MTKKTISSSTSTNVPAATEQRKRSAYTKEFKLRAVELMRQGDSTPTELALELGIRRNQLYKWADALAMQGESDSFPGPGRPTTDQESEMTRLRRELAKALEENAILKKFDAYLTRHKQ